MAVLILTIFSYHQLYSIFTSLSNVVMPVQNMKHQFSVITINLLQSFYAPIQIANYKLLSLSCLLIGSSAALLQNDKVKVVKSCVKSIWIFKTVNQKYFDQGDCSSQSPSGITNIL